MYHHDSTLYQNIQLITPLNKKSVFLSLFGGIYHHQAYVSDRDPRFYHVGMSLLYLSIYRWCILYIYVTILNKRYVTYLHCTIYNIMVDKDVWKASLYDRNRNHNYFYCSEFASYTHLKKKIIS